MSHAPIAEYALLADCQSAALVHRGGSVDWLCLPRFDSPAIFAHLLDARAGHWSIAPSEECRITRRYREHSLVLETTFHTGEGTVVLVDALATGLDEESHGLGMAAPHVLLRRVECTVGAVELVMEYVPRPEYGLVYPLLQADGGNDVVAVGGAAVLRLCSVVPCELADDVARARFTLAAGEAVGFALQHHARWNPAPEPWGQGEIAHRLADTERAWRSWSSEHQHYDGPWPDMVRHSSRVLQGLTYAPTGAIVAAPTTSLPEAVGGERNWDYRYCWLRDASLTLEALQVAACASEAARFFDFVASAALSRVRRGDGLQIMFGVGGEHDLSERELPHLSGWRGSRPVRVGNAAWHQRQLDVAGELMGAAHRLRGGLTDLPSSTRDFLVEVADLAAARWPEPDHGIWEVRGPPAHYVHSKLMSWVALDRAIDMADMLRAHDRVEHWSHERDAVRHAIETRGWSDRAGAFTQTFDGTALDASTLLIPIVGFLPSTDERVRATVTAVRDRLTDRHGLVYRYRTGDNLPGREGTFLLCTFWLSQALAHLGDVDGATEVFERATAFLNDVGLLAEEVDDTRGELLGNFPQAFSHVGLVNAAWAIAQARVGERPEKAT